MSYVKIGPKHQITIPKKVFEALQLEVGDILEVKVSNGKGIFVPKRITEKAPAAKLTPRQQKLLKTVKDKITMMQKDLTTAEGLTETEANLAVKAGLIDVKQRWWWTEEWQSAEREAQKDIDEGRLEEFDNLNDFLKALQS